MSTISNTNSAVILSRDHDSMQMASKNLLHEQQLQFRSPDCIIYTVRMSVSLHFFVCSASLYSQPVYLSFVMFEVCGMMVK